MNKKNEENAKNNFSNGKKRYALHNVFWKWALKPSFSDNKYTSFL